MENIVPKQSEIEQLNSRLHSLAADMVEYEQLNQVLRDSITTLTKNIEKAGIKTEIFSDQLSFQLMIFSIIFLLFTCSISIVSWRFYLNPLKKKISHITDIEFPKIKGEISASLKNEIEKINQRSNEIHNNSIQGISWGLKATKILLSKDGHNMLACFMALRHVQVYLLLEKTDQRVIKMKEELKLIGRTCNEHDFVLNSFGDNKTDVIKILKSLKRFEDDEVSDLAHTIYIKLKTSE